MRKRDRDRQRERQTERERVKVRQRERERERRLNAHAPNIPSGKIYKANKQVVLKRMLNDLKRILEF